MTAPSTGRSGMRVTRIGRSIAGTALVLTTLAACADTTGAQPAATVTVTVATTSTPSPSSVPLTTPADAAAAARSLAKSISRVEKVVKITEDNDPNNLIGRPNGYVSAAVLYDSRTKCSSGLGADCGATVEQWPSPADAKARDLHRRPTQEVSDPRIRIRHDPRGLSASSVGRSQAVNGEGLRDCVLRPVLNAMGLPPRTHPRIGLPLHGGSRPLLTNNRWAGPTPAHPACRRGHAIVPLPRHRSAQRMPLAA